jgi:predicted Rossmann fold flavoprotein
MAFDCNSVDEIAPLPRFPIRIFMAFAAELRTLTGSFVSRSRDIERDVIIIGGGAAGFFAAIHCAESAPDLSVTILEKGSKVLSKVLISGGGRCNVMHSCFQPDDLVSRYPRGKRELLGPFNHFSPVQTRQWFEARGVALKTETDGRMFPTTDRSETIADCLSNAAEDAGVAVRKRQMVTQLERLPDGRYRMECDGGESSWVSQRLMVATGGMKPGPVMESLVGFGHKIQKLAPSLFTFHIDDPRLQGLMGLSVDEAEVSVPGTKLRESGPLLITHWGLSGPAILKLSAWGARELSDREYRFDCRINWIPGASYDDVLDGLKEMKKLEGRKRISATRPFELPRRIWERLVAASRISETMTWSQVGNAALQTLAGELSAADFKVTGKSMNKEEFVTCGGVSLKEVNFKTMESKKVPGLHFGGEVLDIDGITGGFNFQAAWTTGRIAGTAMASPM